FSNASMTDFFSAEFGLYIFILSGFLGFHLIKGVPPLLHTPLMSATNALSGISLVGSIVVAGPIGHFFSTILGFIAVSCSATNVVGGFLITDRMLAMFKREGDRDRPWVMRAGWPVVGIALMLIAGLLYALWLLGPLQHVAAHEVLRWLYLGA